MSYIYHTPKSFKHYSGKGLTPRGGVKIDENGIASNFGTIRDNILVSSFKISTLLKPFTVQAKYKNTKGINSRFDVLTSSKSYPEFCLNFTKTNTKFFTYPNGNKIYVLSNIPFDLQIIGDTTDWFYSEGINDGTNFTYNLYNSHHRLLQTSTVKFKLYNQGGYLVIGHDIDYAESGHTGKYLNIDLSETWIKDSSGKVISPWNLD